MDNSSNLRATTTEVEPMDIATDDWRTTLQPDDRQKHVDKIMESLEKQLPVSSQKGLVEIATTFEEEMYKAATSQSDYLRKISMTLLAMVTKSQTTDMANTIQSNSAGSAQNPPDPESHGKQSQERNQGQPQIPLPNQSQAKQQLSQALHLAQQQQLSRNVQIRQNTIANTGVQISAILPSALTSVTNMQSRIAQNSAGSSINQGLPPSMFSLAHPASQSMQSQGQSQIPLPNQSQAKQHLSSQALQLAQQQQLSRNVQILQNTIANTGVQSSASLPSAPPSLTNMQSRIAQNSAGSSINQGLPPNMFSLAHPMQQIAPQLQQQQSQNPQSLYLQQRQLEQQFQYFQAYQQRINQHMQYLQQQQQLFLQQQIPQLQQQFQQLGLQQQSVQLNGGAYFPTTTTPQLFQVTPPLETSQQHSSSSSSSPQIHDQQQQQQQQQEKQQPPLPISLPKTITPPLQSTNSPSNVVYAASLSTPLLEKDPEKQKQSLLTTAPPRAEFTAPRTNKNLIYFFLSCILLLGFIFYCLVYFNRLRRV